ncbi:tRNA (adenosine(37)-N6)-threonylcarbamoyltransferase complex ATPase subunit type 1 TsaE [Methylothermus subterraneus]
MSFYLPDPETTAAFAKALAQAAEPGTVIYLQGPLGAGKTTLVRAFLRALGFTGKVKSPTFTLVETYAVCRFPVVHFDLYRLADPEELEWMGFREYFGADTVGFIEWPEQGEGFLPPPDLAIRLQLEGEGRRLEMHALSPRGRRISDKITQVFKPSG